VSGATLVLVLAFVVVTGGTLPTLVYLVLLGGAVSSVRAAPRSIHLVLVAVFGVGLVRLRR